MRIRRNRDNKIKIPWYVRRVPRRPVEGAAFTPAEFGFRFPAGHVRPQPVRVAEPVTEPATQPVRQPATDPVRAPDPAMQPVPVPDGLPDLPGIPIPERIPGPVSQRQPEPLSGLPALSPLFQPVHEWEAHFRQLAEQYAQTAQGQPESLPSENPFLKAFRAILEPMVHLLVGREMLNQYVEAKVTDPIYSRMLDDPVLGAVLREAEKADMDVESLANYFANYDWDHFDLVEMVRDLTIILGAAGAARLIIFFIGRRVAFRI